MSATKRNTPDLIEFYETKKSQYGESTVEHISDILNEYKKLYKKEWDKAPTRGFEQSWKPIKGKGLEKLILHIIKNEVENLGLAIIRGNTLDRKFENLPYELEQVKRNLLVDYGEYGTQLPDADLVIYNPKSYKTLVIISSKSTLRERIAQTAYWKMKLNAGPGTRHIKTFFITPDEDGTLARNHENNKSRMIVEVDLDGSYVLSTEVKESDNVKKFHKLIDDLRRLINVKS